MYTCTALSYIFIFKTSEKSLLFSHGLFTLLRIQLPQYDKWFSCSRIHSPWLGRKSWLRPRVVVPARHATYIGWQAGTTTLWRSQLYPPFRDHEFGYSSFVHSPLSPLPPSPPSHRRPRPQPQKNKLVRGPETHTKRQATQHSCLPSLLGDGDEGILIVYGEKMGRLSSQGRTKISSIGATTPTNQPKKIPFSPGEDYTKEFLFFFSTSNMPFTNSVY
jgi:hypothetical protein